MIDNIQKFFQEGILSTNKGKIIVSIFPLSAVFIFIFSFAGKNGVLSSFVRALIGSFISTLIVFIMFMILDKIISPILEGGDSASEDNVLNSPSKREHEEVDYSTADFENTYKNDLNSDLDDIKDQEKLDKSANVDYYQKSTLDKSLDKKPDQNNEANDTIDSIIFPKPKPVVTAAPAAPAQSGSEGKSEYTQVGKNNIEIPSDPEMIAKAVRTMRAKEEDNKG